MKLRGFLLGGLVLVLAAGVAGEHVLRRATQRQLDAAIAAREAFHGQLRAYVHQHERLQADLAAERRRSETLNQSVAEKTTALEGALARLAEETRTVAALQTRLTAMTTQLERLQGELALALEPPAPAGAAVELERVVVSGGPVAGLLGRVVSVHDDWEFIIVNLGWDAVQLGDVISIYRNNTLIAEARIDRIQEDVAAATLLPDWRTAAVQVNDQVRVL